MADHPTLIAAALEAAREHDRALNRGEAHRPATDRIRNTLDRSIDRLTRTLDRPADQVMADAADQADGSISTAINIARDMLTADHPRHPRRAIIDRIADHAWSIRSVDLAIAIAKLLNEASYNDMTRSALEAAKQIEDEAGSPDPDRATESRTVYPSVASTMATLYAHVTG